jgi:single-strand DNA-binding protein
MNHVFLVGRLGRDPEIRYTPSGQPVANFSVAVDESYKDSSGNKVKKTLWMNCVAWAQTAETLNKYMHKGDQIILNGRLQTREYEAKDGTGKRYVTEVVVTRFSFGAKAGASNGSHDDGQGDNGHHDNGTGNGNGYGAPPVDDDIPF